jgi:hypothetical protein
MSGLVVDNQPHGPPAHFMEKLVRGLTHDVPSYAEVGVSGKLAEAHPELRSNRNKFQTRI